VRLVYRILAMLIAAGVVVQAAAIAFALFDIEKKTDDGQVFSKDSHNGGIALHGVLGEMVIPVIALLLLIVSFFAAIPGGVKWAAITFGVLVLQIVLAYAGDALPAVGVLHAINAFALAAVASIAMRKARLAETPAPAAAA
jgi:1,4-dihydroxy-2-naphthoate octaprenyltransferase